jgi:cephalosporin hydroxylase
MARDWFSKVKREFATYTRPFAGKPFTYVECGCWIGGSANWVANNLLTHPDARGFGIDPYAPMPPKHPASEMAVIQATAKAKLQPLEDAGRWTWIVQRSQEALRDWRHGQIDLFYIDGSHHAQDALLDFAMAWPHLRAGSVVVFDDYGIGVRKRKATKMPDVPDACEAILRVFGMFVKEIGRARQLALEVVAHCPPGTELHPKAVRAAIADGRGVCYEETP